MAVAPKICHLVDDTIAGGRYRRHMFATVRLYAGLSDAAVDAVTDHATGIGALLCGVPGCAGAQLIRTRDGLIVVIVGDDEPVLIEAGRRFVAWAHRHVPAFRRAAPPTLWAGDVLLTTRAPDRQGRLAGRT
jgi:hypothetical protein